MTINHKFMIGMIIARSVVNEVAVHRLLARYREAKNLNVTYAADLAYVVDLMNRNDIRLDEFDRIALNHVSTKTKS